MAEVEQLNLCDESKCMQGHHVLRHIVKIWKVIKEHVAQIV